MCVQVINNACATQAIISVLLNVSHQDMDLGSVLTEFKEFSGPLDPAVSELKQCRRDSLSFKSKAVRSYLAKA